MPIIKYFLHEAFFKVEIKIKIDCFVHLTDNAVCSQIGKVVEHAADFYNGRIPKSQRKRTIVDELMADSECRAYQKKKYKEIMDSSRRKGQKAHAKAKKLKKKKK